MSFTRFFPNIIIDDIFPKSAAHSSRADTSHLLTAVDFGSQNVIIQTPQNSSLFKPLKTTALAVLQILFNILLVVESVVFMGFTEVCKNKNKTNETSQDMFKIYFLFNKSNMVLDCSSIVIYSVILVWMFTWLIKSIMRFLHHKHRRSGYLQLHSKLNCLIDIPFNVMLLGNIVLLVAAMLKLDELIPTSIHNFAESPYWLIIQVVICVECIVIFISLIIYIVKVLKFNNSRMEPDVFRENNLSSMPLILTARSAVEVGPGRVDHSEEVNQMLSVCERQADLIEYLRHRCDVLAARLQQVSNAHA